jgi:hypothetical protein
MRWWGAYVTGEIESSTGQAEPAEQHYRRAIDLARSSEATFLVGVATVGLLTVLADAGRVHDALRGYREVIDYFARTGNWTHQWTTLRKLADVLRRLGDNEPATVLDAAAEQAWSNAAVAHAETAWWSGGPVMPSASGRVPALCAGRPIHHRCTGRVVVHLVLRARRRARSSESVLAAHCRHADAAHRPPTAGVVLAVEAQAHTVEMAAESAALPYHLHIFLGDSNQRGRRIVVPRRLGEKVERVGRRSHAEITWKSQTIELDELAPQVPLVTICPTVGNSLGHVQCVRPAGFAIIGERPGSVPLDVDGIPGAETLFVGPPPGARARGTKLVLREIGHVPVVMAIGNGEVQGGVGSNTANSSAR